MATYGPEAARCVVLTFREGVLAGVGHDLVLRVTRLEVTVEGEAVSARIDAGSLRVVTAMHEGRPAPDELHARDKADIEATIRTSVLRAGRFPEIRFSSTAVAKRGDGYEVKGQLAIAGVTREVTLPVQREGDRLVTELRLHQPDFGIRPHRALMGTLRVRADVVVRASVPCPPPGG